MTVYNVAVAIVDLIEADTPEEALAILRERVAAAGLEEYSGGGEAEYPNVFESE